MIDYRSTADEVIASGTDTAILPIGSTEQHGPHLPLCTDFLIAEKLCEKIAEKTGYYLLPVLPISTCYEHKGKKSSVCMRPSTFYTMITDIVLNLKDQGFKRVIIALAHGGIFIAGPVIRELNAMYDDLQVVKLDLVNFMVSPKMNEILDSHDNLHACEYETSLMLYLDEELVRKDKMADADFVPDVPRDYMNYASLIKLSKTGVWGKPSLATKEKGEKIFNLLVEMSLDYIEDVFKVCTNEAW